MADENNPTPAAASPQSPPPEPQAASSPAAPAPPIAAAQVQSGPVKSEREVNLERELAAEREARAADKRKLETEVSERERTIQELKQIPREPVKKSIASRFL